MRASLTHFFTVKFYVNYIRERTLLKEKEVPNYDRSQYECKRSMVKARDGVEVREEIKINIENREGKVLNVSVPDLVSS